MKEKRSTMMLFYALAWVSLLMTAAIAHSHGSLPRNGITTALQWSNFILVVLTIASMHAALEEKKGKSYAKKHGWIAAILLFVFGLGFIVWPPMMYFKLKEQRA